MCRVHKMYSSVADPERIRLNILYNIENKKIKQHSFFLFSVYHSNEIITINKTLRDVLTTSR